MNTFIELKTNHRFNQDSTWGDLLQRMRMHGCGGSPASDIDKVNSKCNESNISEKDIPEDAA